MTSAARKIRIIVIGGSGYAGFEALRWLKRHPAAEVVGVFGPPEETGALDTFFPLLKGQVALRQEVFSPEAVADIEADLGMLCVPHKVAMSYVPRLRERGMRIIDWSADYRFDDVATYEQWYCPHSDSERIEEAVYGLPEYFAHEIADAGIVANPGCYPTCASLALIPPLRAGLIRADGIIVNAVSGITGAGRTPSRGQHYPERNENFEPYAAGGHRHEPEMQQVVSKLSGKKTTILFQPHLCPMNRGMLCTIYAETVPGTTARHLQDALEEAYRESPFTRIRTDMLPATKYVSGTNYCDISVALNGTRVRFFSALDNLLKGASTQAIQNMNIMFGLDETTGLY